MDRLGLAFYWRLLEPYRTRDVEPHGRIILRRAQASREEVPVPITANLLAEVELLLRELRHTRRYGAQPQLGCRGVFCAEKRAETLAAARKRRDLRLV
jgi:hypothetical protein